jgi:hypothetical protein
MIAEGILEGKYEKGVILDVSTNKGILKIEPQSETDKSASK